MQVGMIGLGRMGMNMARRLLRAKHQVVVYNRTPSKVEAMTKEGAIGAATVQELVKKLEPPRVIWLMLPAGDVLEKHVAELTAILSRNDLLVDGGNSFYKDDTKRHAELRTKGIRYLDAGVSGGIWGLENGYCLMVGGDRPDFERAEPLLKDLAPKDGYLHCGPAGAGHFVKMVHNGIEYGMMEAYGEGFEIMKAAPFPIPIESVARLWNHGSVIRSWLLELAADALKADPDLKEVAGVVQDSGEGRWTVQQAVEVGVAAPVISLSLFQRFLSQQKETFSNKVLAALRNKFGGHEVLRAGEAERVSGAGVGKFKPAKGEKK